MHTRSGRTYTSTSPASLVSSSSLQKHGRQVEPPGSCKLHPLTIEHIIKGVLDHLPVSDLKNCRLVNHAWDGMAQKVLRGKAGVFIKFESWEAGRLNNFLRFLSTYSAESPFPFRKFGIHSDVIHFCKLKYKSILSQFFAMVTSWVTHLELKSGIHKILARSQLQLLEFPHLKSLHWTSLQENSTNFDIVQHILEHSPKLDSFGIFIRIIRSYQVIRFEEFLEHIPYPKLRHFQLKGSLGNALLQRFVELGMKQLQSLELEVLNNSFVGIGSKLLTGEGLKQLLERQGDTLQILKLNFEVLSFPLILELPKLPKLTSLEIKDQCQAIPLHLVAIWVSHHLPALKTLSVSERLFYNQSVVFVIAAESVEELEIKPDKEYLHQYLNDDAIAIVAQVFPNLRKLGVPARPMIMKAIQAAKDKKNKFQRLEQLTLFTGGGEMETLLDFTLTGLGPEDEEALIFILNENLAQNERDGCLTPRSFRRFRRMMDTTDTRIPKLFQELKDLEIKPVGAYQTWNMDLSCQLVLLRMQKLQRLDLRGYRSDGSLQISQPAWKDLCENVEVLYDPKAVKIDPLQDSDSP